MGAVEETPRKRRSTRTSLSVDTWTWDDRVSREEARLRRQEIASRWLSKSVERQPMQSLDELAAIPPGTPVVAHLMHGAGNIDAEVGRFLASRLRMAKTSQARGKGRKVKAGHVGKAFGPFSWDSTWPSETHQEITRRVFFDPGDACLARIYRGVRMTAVRYETSQGEHAVLITPTGSSDGVRFEARPGGYGVVWPVRFEKATAALRRALSVLPKPSGDDLAAVMTNGKRVEMPANSLLAALGQDALADPQIVLVELGATSLAWARGLAGGLGEMSFGASTLNTDQIYALLRETGEFPRGFKLYPLIDSAWKALYGPKD
jgi:hypothetical protein